MFANLTPKQFQRLQEIYALEGIRPAAALRGEALNLISSAAAEHGGDLDLDRIAAGDHIEIRVIARLA